MSEWLVSSTVEASLFPVLEVKMFAINSKEDFEAFDGQMDDLLTLKIGKVKVYHTFLGEAFEKLHSREDSSKLMASLLDLQLNFAFMQIDMIKSVGRWNKELKPLSETDSALTILEDKSVFALRLDILRHTSSYVVRTRSFWDKLMGFLVLYVDPKAYKQFTDSKSKKRAFRKIASKWDGVPYGVQHAVVLRFQKKPHEFKALVDLLDADGLYPEPFLSCFLGFMERLDIYRTAEIHGTGKLRKYSLANLPFNESFDLGIVMNSWNHALYMMNAVVDEFIVRDLKNLKESPRYLNPDEYV